MIKNDQFDLQDFMPYLLNQAAEVTSRKFETYYRSKYEMLRTEWRVVFHLGRYGEMTAKEVCDWARIHKTKVSRAVLALEKKRYLKRERLANDRRHEILELTNSGKQVFADLFQEAKRFDKEMMSCFTPEEQVDLQRMLKKILASSHYDPR